MSVPKGTDRRPFDPSIANPARMYDFYLGGKDNYAADREAAGRILEIAPETVDLVRENRAFLRRAVEFLLDEGVRQFLDIGAGIPTQGNVHEIVTARAPDARIVCVDNDPVACSHARALTGGGFPVLQADMRDPDSVIEGARTTIDFTEPVGLIFAAVLHFVPDDAEASGVVAAYRDVVAKGSLLLLSHGTQDGISAEVAEEGTQIYRKSSAPTRLRTPAEVTRLFDGFSLVDPGLVNVANWRPDSVVRERSGAYMLGGVARRN